MEIVHARYHSLAELVEDEVSKYGLESAARNLSARTNENLDYTYVAGILLAKHLQNESLSEYDLLTQYPSLFGSHVRQFILDNYEVLNSRIRNDMDFTYQYRAIKTISSNYLFKIEGKPRESLQWSMMRMAVQVSMDKDGNANLQEVLDNYDMFSSKEATHATPTWTNAGFHRAQLESCFLVPVGDSMDMIQAARTMVAMGSKANGGFGLDCGRIRHSRVSNRGQTKGVPGMLKFEFNPLLSYADQLGSRPGACTAFLPIWHIDIYTFSKMGDRKSAESIRADNLNYSIWVQDLFMKRRLEDGTWSLFCPRETQKLWARLHGLDDSDSKVVDKCPSLHDMWGVNFEKFYLLCEKHISPINEDPNLPPESRTVWKANELWSYICEQRCRRGQPFIMYGDSCNRKSNQQHLGTITQSNLCVRGDTLILTDKGYVPIQEVVGQSVNVWNGEEWSPVVPLQTGENQELLTIEFSNGSTLHCTPYHKFYTISGSKNKNEKVVEARNLKIDDKLVRCDYPIVESFDPTEDSHFGKYAYTHGFFCGDGLVAQGLPQIWLYDKKKSLIKFIDMRGESRDEPKNNRIWCPLPVDLPAKFAVPLRSSVETKVKWLAGYLDADGCVVKNGTTRGMQCTSTNFQFMENLKLLLQTLGCNCKYSKILDAKLHLMPTNDATGSKKEYMCNAAWRMCIGSRDLAKLYNLGFRPHRLDIGEPTLKDKDVSRFISVTAIKKEDEKADTFCFTEHRKNRGIFNGVLAGNCVEIVQYTKPGEQAATCDLATVNLAALVKDGKFDFERLGKITRQLVRNLNRVLDVTCGILDNSGQKVLDEILRTYPKDSTEYKMAEQMYPHVKKDPTYTARMQNRAIGIGKMGLASTFMLLGMEYTSKEAVDLATRITACIYWHSVDESHKLAMKDGSYPSFEGSPMSKGILQPDMWLQETEYFNQYLDTLDKDKIQKMGLQDYIKRFSYKLVDPSSFGVSESWYSLRERCKMGMRNSLLTCQMPNVTTSAQAGVTPSVEPIFSVLYSFNSVNGKDDSFPDAFRDVMMQHDLYDPVKLAEYLFSNKGDAKGISLIFEGKKKEQCKKLEGLFTRAYDINKKKYFLMIQKMGYYVCQSQSLNWYFELPSDKYMSELDILLWVNGAKNAQYYVYRKASADSISVTKTEAAPKICSLKDRQNGECLSCQ